MLCCILTEIMKIPFLKKLKILTELQRFQVSISKMFQFYGDNITRDFVMWNDRQFTHLPILMIRMLTLEHCTTKTKSPIYLKNCFKVPKVMVNFLALVKGTWKWEGESLHSALPLHWISFSCRVEKKNAGFFFQPHPSGGFLVLIVYKKNGFYAFNTKV